jgi:hypothetical protein
VRTGAVAGFDEVAAISPASVSSADAAEDGGGDFNEIGVFDDD